MTGSRAVGATLRAARIGDRLRLRGRGKPRPYGRARNAAIGGSQ
jgi:hypothetical protein